VVLATHWGDAARARRSWRTSWVDLCEQKSNFQFVYDEKDTLWDKVNKIAKKIYRASEVTADGKVRARSRSSRKTATGITRCASRRHILVLDDAQLRAAPSNHVVNVREVRLAAGAEFVVMICGIS